MLVLVIFIFLPVSKSVSKSVFVSLEVAAYNSHVVVEVKDLYMNIHVCFQDHYTNRIPNNIIFSVIEFYTVGF